MIFNVFDFADAQAKDVMVQRDTIVAVDSNKKKVDNTKTIDKEKIKEELELKKDAKEDIPVEEGLTSDETVKLKNIEEQMKTLYDRVNDVVNDLDYDDSGVFDIDLLSEEIEKSNIDNNQKKKYKFKNLKFNKINEKISDIGGEAINKIREELSKGNSKKAFKKLKEQLGHQPLEVLVGGLLGVIVASIFTLV